MLRFRGRLNKIKIRDMDKWLKYMAKCIGYIVCNDLTE